LYFDFDFDQFNIEQFRAGLYRVRHIRFACGNRWVVLAVIDVVRIAEVAVVVSVAATTAGRYDRRKYGNRQQAKR